MGFSAVGISEARENGVASGIGLVAFFTFVSAFFCTILGLVITIVANVATDHQDDYAAYGLEAIKDGNTITGDFVLGTGILTSNATYTFYDNSNGAIHLEKVEASDIALYEDSAKPYVVEYIGCHLKPNWLAPCLTDDPRFVEIHVPPGSVKNQINLDLNGN
ncbi:hypothetical protein [Nocardia jiangxiensis]|uniref:hypothetical protein n=1 Tax=Nocardia jiangxiensis TaxID=282685 RepID=UPI0012F6AE1A|nr:hypothetical protein [Nocardia jiangxiensis]